MTETTDPTVTIRPAETSDAEAIAALFTDEGYPAGPSDIVERMARFGSEHSRVIVAEHEGALLGFIALHAIPRFEHEDRILRVLALVVDAVLRAPRLRKDVMDIDLIVKERGHVHRLVLHPVHRTATHQEGIDPFVCSAVARMEGQKSLLTEYCVRDRVGDYVAASNPVRHLVDIPRKSRLSSAPV